MKICYIADMRSIHTYKIVSYFANNNIVDLISLKYNDTLRSGLTQADYEKLGITVHTIPKTITGLMKSPFIVKKLLRKLNPDIIHSHYITHYGFLGAWSKFHPFIISVWGSDILIDPYKSKLFNMTTTYSLKRADMVICDWDGIIDKLVARGVDPTNIHEVYFGTDTTVFIPTRQDLELLKSHGISTEPVIISLRNLKPIYDVETLIHAIPHVLAKHPHAQFIIAGAGSDSENLKAMTYFYNIDSNVHFIGSIKNEDIPKYLNSSSIYVSTSLSDSGLSISTSEAMSCALPVIVTDAPNNTQWIHNYENGFLFDPHSHIQLSNRIIYLLDHPEQRAMMGAYNRSLIRTHHNYTTEMKKIECLYKHLLENHS